jgi:hypothetical protein
MVTTPESSTTSKRDENGKRTPPIRTKTEWYSNYLTSTRLLVESTKTQLNRVDFRSRLSRNLDANSKICLQTPDLSTNPPAQRTTAELVQLSPTGTARQLTPCTRLLVKWTIVKKSMEGKHTDHSAVDSMNISVVQQIQLLSLMKTNL